MEMDMLNFTIQSLCTHLQDHNIQYEEEKFQKLLDELPRQRIHSFLSVFTSLDGQNSQKDFPKGFDPIQEELLKAGHRLGSVIHHDRQVFGPYYSGILKKVLLPEAEPDLDAGMDSSRSSSPHPGQGWNTVLQLFHNHASACKNQPGKSTGANVATGK